MPNVRECLDKARDELRQASPQNIVNAVILLAAASRGLERESFMKLATFMRVDGPETLASAIVEERMETTFTHTVEALGHITVLGICQDLEDRQAQLDAAELHTGMALASWSELSNTLLMPGPEDLQ